MGTPMALNLAAAGFPLTVWNRTRDRCAPLADAGAAVATSPQELAGASDIVVTMLSDGAAARAVLTGEEGVLDPDHPGIVIEMSTIGPAAAQELAAVAAGRGWGWADAPVSGSTAFAEQAKLTTMVGAEQVDYGRAEPVLEAMTAARYHLGGPGAGAAMKLAINLIIAATTEAVSEALVLAERAGIERAGAYEVIANSAVGSPFVAYKRAAFLDPDGEAVGFSLDLMQKDLDLALAQARAGRIPALAGAAAREGISLAAGLCGGDQDLVRIADALRTVASRNQRRR
jgi:3-hydroxyisobutyrate dehydrogenase-like beta-hydroxyacid dehydrogenase